MVYTRRPRRAAGPWSILAAVQDLLGSPYLVMLAAAFAAAFAWAHRRAPRLGIDRLALTDVCIAALVGGIVGARLLHVAAEPLPGDPLDPAGVARVRELLPALEPDARAAVARALDRPAPAAAWDFIARMPAGPAREAAIAAAERDPAAVPARLWYRARPVEVLLFWKGGLAYLGGLGLATVLALATARRHGARLGDMADLAAPAIALGLALGRVGCLLEGCCYGAPCPPGPWAAPPLGRLLGVPRWPTALLEAGWDLGMFVALQALLSRRRARWEAFLALLVLYAPGRFLIEALRDDPRGGAGGLSTSQWLVLLTGPPALLGWLWLRTRGPRLDDAPRAPPAGASPDAATAGGRADASREAPPEATGPSPTPAGPSPQAP